MQLPRCVVFKLQMSLSCEGTANIGPKKPLSDHVSIMEPKDEILPTSPSQNKNGILEGPSVTQPVFTAQQGLITVSGGWILLCKDI